MHKNATYETARTYISNMEDFANKNETFSGYSPAHAPHGKYYTGRLNDEAAETLKQMVRDDEIDFIVYSYVTPIAWHSRKHGWFEVKQKFTMTTSKQQSVVRRAVNIENTI